MLEHKPRLVLARMKFSHKPKAKGMPKEGGGNGVQKRKKGERKLSNRDKIKLLQHLLKKVRSHVHFHMHLSCNAASTPASMAACLPKERFSR